MQFAEVAVQIFLARCQKEQREKKLNPPSCSVGAKRSSPRWMVCLNVSLHGGYFY